MNKRLMLRVTLPCARYLEQQLVLGYSLYGLEQVGVERKLVTQVELDGLEESLILRVLAEKGLRIRPVLTVRRVHLKLLRLLLAVNTNSNKNTIHSQHNTVAKAHWLLIHVLH